MYFHFAVLLFFRPLTKLRIIGSKIVPRDVCYQAADAIQGLTRSYARLYTLRRIPSFVPYFVLVSSVMHLVLLAQSALTKARNATDTPDTIGPEQTEASYEAINQGIADLAEMAPCHLFAERALNILRYLSNKWHLNVDTHNNEVPAEDWTRLGRPVACSLNFFAPNFDEQNCATMHSRTEASGADSPSSQGYMLEDPLFWPFPSQGRPMMPDPQDLEQVGFEML